ncbi:MAG: TAXI family TRAP transporter solute-binding subunit, partial [Myxococcota bacterium]
MRNFRLYVSLAAMAGVLVVVVALTSWQLGLWRRQGHWTLTTGHAKGMYWALGSEMRVMLDRAMPDDTFEIRPSAGSVENMRMVADRVADFAFVQSDTRPPSNARLVATLYTEVVHIAVRAELIDDVSSIEDLPQLTHVSLGAEGS